MLKLLVLLLLCKKLDLSIRAMKFSTLYCTSVTKKFLFARSTTSTRLWASLSCSSMSLDFVGISIGDKFSSLANFSAGMTSWFLNRIIWLKTASPILSFSTSWNSCCHLFWTLWLLKPNIVNHFWTKKIVQICLGICQSPVSRYKLACLRNQ